MGADELRDLPAAVAADHDVDGEALGVLAVAAERAVRRDLGERGAHGLRGPRRCWG